MGVLTYILISGKVPFGGENNKEIIENVLKAELHFNHKAFTRVSDKVKHFISNLLVRDPEKRYGPDQAWEHEWLHSTTENSNVPLSLETAQNIDDFKQGA